MDMQDCIDNCTDCHRICTEAAAYCLDEGGEMAIPAHIRLLLDCAQICQTSADFMLRLSDHHVMICRVCAEICEACAQACLQFEQDEEMAQCARICTQCATSCREMGGTEF